MARKREAEDAEAAKTGDYSDRHKQSAKLEKKQQQSRHSAYRESQNLSQRPGSFLRRLGNGANTQGRGSKKPSGQEGIPGAPPSGNRPINPFK